MDGEGERERERKRERGEILQYFNSSLFRVSSVWSIVEQLTYLSCSMKS